MVGLVVKMVVSLTGLWTNCSARHDCDPAARTGNSTHLLQRKAGLRLEPRLFNRSVMFLSVLERPNTRSAFLVLSCITVPIIPFHLPFLTRCIAGILLLITRFAIPLRMIYHNSTIFLHVHGTHCDICYSNDSHYCRT